MTCQRLVRDLLETCMRLVIDLLDIVVKDLGLRLVRNMLEILIRDFLETCYRLVTYLFDSTLVSMSQHRRAGHKPGHLLDMCAAEAKPNHLWLSSAYLCTRDILACCQQLLC